MSYTPTTWQTGDTITAEKLNNMEGGIQNANEPFVVTVTGTGTATGSRADKTYAEIVAAFEASKEVRLVYNGSVYFLSSVTASDVSFSYLDQSQSYVPFARIDSGGHFYAVSRSFMLSADVVDNGKGLVVKNGAWAKGFPAPFVVTLTPTAQDFSGTMDKTVAEINAAYEAGQQIVFRTMMSATEHMDADCTARWFNGSTYPSFNGFILDDGRNMIIFAYTGARDDGTWQNYGTKLYPLTTMSE